MNSSAELLTLVDRALAEDVGSGDWTTLWTVPGDRVVTARIVAKAPGIISGLEAVRITFQRIEPGLDLDFRIRDGDLVRSGQEVVRIRGLAHSILTGERVALNFLQRLSGVATLTRTYVEAVAGTSARIIDTRKTTPGLRWLEKEAVLAGGGQNHRFGLYDMILIKENHIRAAGGITAAVTAVREKNVTGLAIEVETTTLGEVAEALSVGVDRILLDNMRLETLREAVQLIHTAGSRIETEASGGVSLASVRGVAETGVDYISVGALTHSAPALDLSLLVDIDG